MLDETSPFIGKSFCFTAANKKGSKGNGRLSED
jgi:hypothetical protein